MSRNLGITELSNVMSAISHYQDLPSHFTQLCSEQTESLEKFWKKAFPSGYMKDQYEYAQWTAANIHIILQGWSNTSCGWETIGGSAISHAYTTVIENRTHGIALIYYGCKLAYMVYMDEKYKDFIKEMGYERLPGMSKCTKVLNVIFKTKR